MDKIVLDFVKLPKALKEVKEQRAFVELVSPDLNKMSIEGKQEITFELVCYLCSVAELFFLDRHQGDIKKKCVVNCLSDVESVENLDKMVELGLKSGEVERITTLKRIKIYLKKKVMGVIPRNM
jgi:hypothetical protein